MFRTLPPILSDMNRRLPFQNWFTVAQSEQFDAWWAEQTKDITRFSFRYTLDCDREFMGSMPRQGGVFKSITKTADINYFLKGVREDVLKELGRWRGYNEGRGMMFKKKWGWGVEGRGVLFGWNPLWYSVRIGTTADCRQAYKTFHSRREAQRN
ncbi:hypothetical protein DPMN_006274 [Dreissena polymorpha]|uniref:Uncharacterized protein n=1 Tax=Dreissena polymorpha TaxID=45954 RepID=A0A9D4MV47_DREPO|nr:hypothetical protein DPMN_006274 [Dreissena polymorpha]